jgi:hypothetical protein
MFRSFRSFRKGPVPIGDLDADFFLKGFETGRKAKGDQLCLRVGKVPGKVSDPSVEMQVASFLQLQGFVAGSELHLPRQDPESFGKGVRMRGCLSTWQGSPYRNAIVSVGLVAVRHDPGGNSVKGKPGALLGRIDNGSTRFGHGKNLR